MIERRLVTGAHRGASLRPTLPELLEPLLQFGPALAQRAHDLAQVAADAARPLDRRGRRRGGKRGVGTAAARGSQGHRSHTAGREHDGHSQRDHDPSAFPYPLHRGTSMAFRVTAGSSYKFSIGGTCEESVSRLL